MPPTESEQSDAPTPRAHLAELAQAVASILAAMPAQAEQVEGLDGPAAAKFLGIGLSTLHDLNARGLMPESVTLGDKRCRRWMRSELIEWMRAGCPSRLRWELMRKRAV